MVQQKRFKI
uniref:Uncharacterized protein n=1 Tax=Romanomermis culicivorax TaxID=13658 RepID=A0A915JDG9_ROMCU